LNDIDVQIYKSVIVYCHKIPPTKRWRFFARIKQGRIDVVIRIDVIRVFIIAAQMNESRPG
jgi:hypothetical protein